MDITNTPVVNIDEFVDFDFEKAEGCFAPPQHDAIDTNCEHFAMLQTCTDGSVYNSTMFGHMRITDHKGSIYGYGLASYYGSSTSIDNCCVQMNTPAFKQTESLPPSYQHHKIKDDSNKINIGYSTCVVMHNPDIYVPMSIRVVWNETNKETKQIEQKEKIVQLTQEILCKHFENTVALMQDMDASKMWELLEKNKDEDDELLKQQMEEQLNSHERKICPFCDEFITIDNVSLYFSHRHRWGNRWEICGFSIKLE